MKFNRAESLADFSKQTRKEGRNEKVAQIEKHELDKLKEDWVKLAGNFDTYFYEQDNAGHWQPGLKWVPQLKGFFKFTVANPAEEFIKCIPQEFLNDSKFWVNLLKQDGLRFIIPNCEDYSVYERAFNELYKHIPVEVKSSREVLIALAQILNLYNYGSDNLADYRKMDPAEREKRLVETEKDYPAIADVIRKLLALEK